MGLKGKGVVSSCQQRLNQKRWLWMKKLTGKVPNKAQSDKSNSRKEASDDNAG